MVSAQRQEDRFGRIAGLAQGAQENRFEPAGKDLDRAGPEVDLDADRAVDVLQGARTTKPRQPPQVRSGTWKRCMVGILGFARMLARLSLPIIGRSSAAPEYRLALPMRKGSVRLGD
jgi:hypothetical protein